MRGREVVEQMLEDHGALRANLLEWEAALQQVRGSTYGQCQHAVSVLRHLCRVVERELRLHVQEEETVLYAAVEAKLPPLRALVGELRREHDVFRQVFEDFRRELVHFNATGELRELLPLGRELVRTLRQHVEREERELHSVVLRQFAEEDWGELARLYNISGAA